MNMSRFWQPRLFAIVVALSFLTGSGCDQPKPAVSMTVPGVGDVQKRGDKYYLICERREEYSNPGYHTYFKTYYEVEIVNPHWLRRVLAFEHHRAYDPSPLVGEPQDPKPKGKEPTPTKATHPETANSKGTGSAAPMMKGRTLKPGEANPDPGNTPEPIPITTPEHRPPPPLPPTPVQTVSTPEHPQPKPVPPHPPSGKTASKASTETRPEADSTAQSVATETARSVTKEVNRPPAPPPPPPPPPPMRHGPP